MLNYTLNQREYQYQNLNDFTTKIHREIVDVTSNLGWTVESIETDNDNRLVCLYNSSHRIGKKILDQHLESCRWKKEGYNEFDVPLSDPSLPSCSPFSIKLDVPLQDSILQEAKKVDSSMKFESYECCTWHKLCMGERLIPQTSDRIFADFTRDERRMLYEYIVSNTAKTNIGYDITNTHRLQNPDEKEDKKLSFIELLVQERNLKRRRAKHRGVHTNKKSHTEILREIINQQMELYIDCMHEIHAISHDTHTADKYFDDTMQNLLLSSSDSSLKRHKFFLEDSQDNHCGSSKSRHEQISKQSEATYTLHSKDREKQEKCSRSVTTIKTTKTTESRKNKKSHKRRRSRSRERSRDNRNKHWSVRQSHKKDNMKLREIEKSIGSNYYSKHSSDRR